jgi:hypothetical protein
VPAEQSDSTCANCGATLLADQRYCLECGQPASPVRLAFLDVLESDQASTTTPTGRAVPVAAGYAPVYDTPGAAGWLRRNNGVLALLAVLALCLIAGLLVGHWASGKQAPAAPTVVKVEGLGGSVAATPTGGATSTPATSTPESTKSSAKEEAEAAKAASKETAAEKAPPPAPKKVTKTQLQKLSTTTGKKHHEEIEANGAAPIETG